MTCLAGQYTQPRILDRVGILEFIDEQVSEAIPVVPQQVFVVQPQLMRPKQQLREVDEPGSLAGFFIGLIDLAQLDDLEIVVRIDMGRTQSLILGAMELSVFWGACAWVPQECCRWSSKFKAFFSTMVLGE